ncbi:MAG: hypothetical protein IKA19_04995 [Muribaculaceae bacterium]|nr:hypothetical protein [Muribaculaceae bacterium]MBR1964031.1 hypothetical protein [Muribaculaceae bacterium]
MKIQYKLGLLACGLLALSSCEKNDPMADHMQIGQYVPTCYWEVGSTACKAGEAFSFKAKYWTEEGFTPVEGSVWYSVVRTENAQATTKLAGTALTYTKSGGGVDTVRTMQCIATFPHDPSTWNGTEFEMVNNVPVSSTLSPVSWINIKEWDQKKFDLYYPEGFDEEFKATVISNLVTDSYYNALRAVYLNYEFTNEWVGEINAKYGTNLPTDIKIDEGDAGAALADKSDRWYTTTEASEDAIINYYYNSVVDSVTVAKVVAIEDVTITEDGAVLTADNNVKVYPVYDAAEWVFCRYDDDLGSIVNSVKEEYLPAFAELLSVISFEEWIYDGKAYAVTFTRDYHIETLFKVEDDKGNMGVANGSVPYTITIN